MASRPGRWRRQARDGWFASVILIAVRVRSSVLERCAPAPKATRKRGTLIGRCSRGACHAGTATADRECEDHAHSLAASRATPGQRRLLPLQLDAPGRHPIGARWQAIRHSSHCCLCRGSCTPATAQRITSGMFRHCGNRNCGPWAPGLARMRKMERTLVTEWAATPGSDSE